MIFVQNMKPFYSKLKPSENKLRLVFAYKYFSITKDEEVYQFIPIEGKEMIIDTNTKQVQNLKEVFVFQRGNRFIRLPLYQLLLVSNVQTFLKPMIELILAENPMIDNSYITDELETETIELIEQLEYKNLYQAIDDALDSRNEVLFMELTARFNNLQTNDTLTK